jgi:hypothetical protein
VLLQRHPIKQAVINAMGHALILSVSTGTEIAHGVIPAMLQQMLKAKGFQLLSPDPVGVRPGSINWEWCNPSDINTGVT